MSQSIDPDPRILQANERTLLAWIRTGLTLMAFGFVVGRISVWLRVEHPEREHDAMGAWLGIIVVALGTVCQLLGAIRFVRARRAILAKQSIESSVVGPVAFALSVSALGVAALAYLNMTAS